jgi:hypothetical protein
MILRNSGAVLKCSAIVFVIFSKSIAIFDEMLYNVLCNPLHRTSRDTMN